MIALYILLCINRPLFSPLAYRFSFACTYKVLCFIFIGIDEVHVGHVTFTNGVLRGSPVEDAMHTWPVMGGLAYIDRERIKGKEKVILTLRPGNLELS